MNVKLIALDLDRTTLNSQGKLSNQNRQAIIQVIQQGKMVVIASGRPFLSLPKDVIEIPGISYAITSNGTAVYNMKNKQCIVQYKLSRESVLWILDRMSQEQIAYEAFIDGVAYANQDYIENPVLYGATEHAIEYIQATRKPVEDIISFIQFHCENLDCLDIVVKSKQKKEQLMEILGQNKELYITSSVQQLIEIVNIKAGKKSGLVKIGEITKILPEEMAAFGDAHNDLDMIQYVGYGVAMENATEELKNAANFVTKSNDEDGVAYAIGSYLL